MIPITYIYSPCTEEKSKDIIAEAIEFFRANVLFRSYIPEGGADLVLCYLTVYIGELIRHLKASKTLADAKKNVISVSLSQSFALPGDSGFCFSGFCGAPQSKAESDQIRQYLYHIRQETAARILDTIYNPDGTQNKWWFSFQKRKFMNIDKA